MGKSRGDLTIELIENDIEYNQELIKMCKSRIEAHKKNLKRLKNDKSKI